MYIPDILDGFSQISLKLPSDDEGQVVCTLIKSNANKHSSQTVLYIHGFVDYFFQKELAQHYIDQGINFYAIDLRKFGRSLRPWHTPYLVSSISDYFLDLDLAIEQIRTEETGSIHLNGHSTGGLTACLYIQARPDLNIKSLILNSPFLELNKSWFIRKLALPCLCSFTNLVPNLNVRTGFSKWYAYSLLKSKKGAWEYNETWKVVHVNSVKLRWLNAIFQAQKQLQKGLNLDLPVLLMHSAQSYKGSKCSTYFNKGDIVLNVKHMVLYAPCIGSKIQCVAFQDALHDLILSAPNVRKKVYQCMSNWMTDMLTNLSKI